MCCRLIAIATVVIAVLMAILANFKAGNGINQVVMVIFSSFQIMIPVLAIGALLKYLFCDSKHSHGDNCDCNDDVRCGGAK